MKKKLYLMMGCILMLQAPKAVAQCAGGRYLNQIFSESVSTVTYSTDTMMMDIYEPTGDTSSARPLIILAHGGSFIGGTRTADATVDSICVRFAKRGYVTASIDYRLSTLGNMISSDSTLPIDEVIKAVSDGKAAIRYFVKDRATSNTYKIDTNNIFIGGNSAGAVLYMHVGYLDSLGECPSYIQTAMAANGGFEGNSGNPGYTTKSRAIISLAGGLNKVAFVGPGDKPSVNCQGDQDAVVPYYCAYPNFGSSSFPVNVQVKLCGLGSLEPQYVAEGIYHWSMVFPGAGHVPWDSNPAELNTVDSFVTQFLYNFVCGTVSVNQVNLNAEVSLFPNPASDIVNIKSSEFVNDITMYDEIGRVVLQASGINKTDYEINTAHFSKGLYFVKMRFSNENNSPVVKRIVLE